MVEISKNKKTNLSLIFSWGGGDGFQWEVLGEVPLPTSYAEEALITRPICCPEPPGSHSLQPSILQISLFFFSFFSASYFSEQRKMVLKRMKDNFFFICRIIIEPLQKKKNVRLELYRPKRQLVFE